MAGKIPFALIVVLVFTAAVGEKTGVNSTLGVALKTADCVTEAAASDMTEIAAAKIALQKGDADEKQFADQMVRDHTRTSDELKGTRIPRQRSNGSAHGAGQRRRQRKAEGLGATDASSASAPP